MSAAAAADLHIGRRIRERRIQRGLSLAEVAQALGVSTQQAGKYEAGRNGIPAARLPDLAALLGVEVAWLFEGLEQFEELGRWGGAYRPLLPTRPRMLLDLIRATDALPEPGLRALCEASRALSAPARTASAAARQERLGSLPIPGPRGAAAGVLHAAHHVRADPQGRRR